MSGILHILILCMLYKQSFKQLVNRKKRMIVGVRKQSDDKKNHAINWFSRSLSSTMESRCFQPRYMTFHYNIYVLGKTIKKI